MMEAAFPLLGTAFVMLVVLPACALVAKGILAVLEREDLDGTLHRLSSRHLVLVGSSAIPLAWFLSAGLHQLEAGAVVTCLFDHETAALCFEPGLFSGALGVLLFGLSAKSLRAASGPRLSNSERARALRERAGSIVSAKPWLKALSTKMGVTEEPGFALATLGGLRPKVVLGLAYAEALPNEALASALAHEAEHVRAHDPLRYALLSVCLAVNPFGRWLLDAHAARWLGAREAHCDREAVVRGAEPLPLAEAIVQAARPPRLELAGLAPHDTRMLKFRIGMLLAFAEKRPARCCGRSGTAVPAIFVLLLGALLLPHHTGTHVLDAVHVGAEHAFTYVWR